MRQVILDSGPLVAWFCPRDEHHAWAKRVFTELEPGSIICEAVLTEVCHLAAKEGIERAKVIRSLRAGRLEFVSLSNELEVVETLLSRYKDIPMDFADACVVRLAELHPRLVVCTTDRHFQFFRKSSTEPIPLLASYV